MKITVVDRKGKPLVKDGLYFASYQGAPTVNDLMNAMCKHNPALPPERQRWTLPAAAGDAKAKPASLESGKKLSDYGLGDGSTVVFKDLGPQIGYSTVFFWEYFGPMVIYPAILYLRGAVYGDLAASHPATKIQTAAAAFWFLHYLKRIVETFTVHNFSHGTMPLFNLFKNCSYYWGFAAWVGYFVNHPLYTPVSPAQQAAGLAFGVAMELSNAYCHVILARLRSSGGGGYKIPRGFLFDVPGITCANYFAEIMAWLGFNVATQSLAGYAFMCAGAAQMVIWAQAKHRRLRKLFDGKDGKDKYPRRWVILPPFL